MLLLHCAVARRAAACPLLLVVALGTACIDSPTGSRQPPAEYSSGGGNGSVDIGLTLLSLSTPDGSGQTVHPDYLAVPASWSAASQYLVLTPYPNGNAAFENPSLFSGPDGIAWSTPAGVTNPIASPKDGYLSDPDALFVPESNELWIYYRSVDAQNTIRLVKSADGVHFGAPTIVAQGVNHTIVSPTVARRGATDWLMWAVNANVGCSAAATTVEVRHSPNGTDWSEPLTVSLTQPGYSVWHIDVQWIPSRHEFWALYNVKTPGSCTTPAVFLATSADGETWKTYPSPVLAHGAIPAFEDVVYRSTFDYDAATDAISLWYSGARYESPNYVWRSAYQRRSRADVFAGIASKAKGASLDRRPGRIVPPLLDAP
ncbi:MAG TPA: hypothetical protein VH277_14825 [Gemmatimonadaceae bacterium]|jgi:hypothetical protein|nr:hypothetical protein [Gemmatimonadaceae bacterium]